MHTTITVLIGTMGVCATCAIIAYVLVIGHRKPWRL
jgi:hypothetical protein